MSPFAKFNLRVLAGMAALVIAAVAINAIVDPVNQFDAVSIRGFNAIKTQVNDSTLRRYKAAELERHQYQVLYLGSSRIFLGLDPARGFPGDANVYNVGLGGANFYETYQIFKFVRRHQKPAVIVLGVDFFAFNARQTVSGDYALSLFGKGKAETYFNYLLSWDMLKLSIATVQDNLGGHPFALFTPLGFRDLDRQFLGQSFPHHRQFEYGLNRYLRVDEYYGDYLYTRQRMELLGDLIDECRREGIRLYIYTTPVHAAYHEAMRVVGITFENERWRRDLAALVEEKNRDDPGTPIAIWDFMGYSSINSEDIPPESRPDQRMLYQWDGAHNTTMVGNWILDILISDGRNRGGAPPDFGVKLSPDIMKALLALDRRRQKEFERRRPEVVRLVEEQARITRRFRPAGATFYPLLPPSEKPKEPGAENESFVPEEQR